MKTRRLISITVACLLGATFLPGCGTTTETKITQANKVVITGVNDGMAEWALYVNAGKAKQSQINAIHTAYDGYYAAQQVLKAVCEKMAAKDPTATAADLETARQAVANAEDVVLAELSKIMNIFISK